MNDGEWKKVLTLGKDATSYTTKVMGEGTYHYQVKAARYDSIDRVMTNGSNIVEGVIDETNNILIITSNDDHMTLSWNKLPSVSGYEVYRSTNGGQYRLLKRTSSLSLETNKKEGTTYTYKVRGFKLVNQTRVYTSFSNEVSD